VRSRSFVAVALSMVVLFGGAGALLAYDSSQAQIIAKGIRIAGLDVGGMSVSQATARVTGAYRARLRHPVVLRFGSERFVLGPRSVHLAIDARASAQQALDRTRADNLLTRALRSLTGGAIHANIDPQLTYSNRAIARFTSRVSRALDRPARDAGISYSGSSIGTVSSQTGIEVRRQQLIATIEAALTRTGDRGPIEVPVNDTMPKLTTRALAARYPTIITVDRSAFTLRLWKHLRLVRSYTIAVGMAGLQTPAGLYHVQDKEVNPSWHVPNSSWAGALAGKTIPPGPQDPLKARWMGIFNGAGIHGTDVLSSLGSAASHGCIRMAIPDVIALYDQTPLGTPVYVA
jgi:lipoprotein-anchoring transpeptidase ErfK/SrfK